MSGSRSAPLGGVALLLVGAWFLVGTVPYLSDYPIPDWAEMGIAAPAHKLVAEGIYGNDLFAGYHRSELRNYEYMPAYALLVAASFRLCGLGVGSARAVSIVCGLLIVLLTYRLGSRFDRQTGLVAAAFLVVVPLSPAGSVSGITLLDFARTSRYDLLVPVFGLAASLTLLRAAERARGPRNTAGAPRRASGGLRERCNATLAFVGVGALVGLATLSHLYGAFLLPVFALFLFWHGGATSRPARRVGLMLSGWAFSLSPWIAYVMADPQAWLGQISRHEGRFALFDPGFYIDNLGREPSRYAGWVGGIPEGLLTPRLGIWILLVGAALGWRRLWNMATHRGADEPPKALLAAPLILLAVPLLALQLAALISLKRHIYVLVLLPFLAVQFAVGADVALGRVRAARSELVRVAAALLAGVVLLEGASGIQHMLARARRITPYATVVGALGEEIPEGARVLLSQPYWLGLASRDARSLNLPILRAIEAQPNGLRGTWSNELAENAYLRAIRDIDPDYVVVERFWIDPTIADERGTTDPRWRSLWRRLGSHIEAECDRVATVDDPSYGVIDVYRCR